MADGLGFLRRSKSKTMLEEPNTIKDNEKKLYEP